MINTNVHITHCCKWHGCKYGDPDCPVVLELARQEYICEECNDDLCNEDYFRKSLQNIEEIKKFLKGEM